MEGLRLPNKTFRRRTGASASSGVVATVSPVLRQAFASAASPDLRLPRLLGLVLLVTLGSAEARSRRFRGKLAPGRR